MSITRTLADALYREKIARARSMNPVDKLLEGPRLFERARRVMIDGIRHQHPELDASEVGRAAPRSTEPHPGARPVMTADQAVVAVFGALEATEIPYMIVGSLAANFHGIPRSTRDADSSSSSGPAVLTGSTKHFRRPDAKGPLVAGTCPTVKIPPVANSIAVVALRCGGWANGAGIVRPTRGLSRERILGGLRAPTAHPALDFSALTNSPEDT